MQGRRLLAVGADVRQANTLLPQSEAKGAKFFMSYTDYLKKEKAIAIAIANLQIPAEFAKQMDHYRLGFHFGMDEVLGSSSSTDTTKNLEERQAQWAGYLAGKEAGQKISRTIYQK